ncbi:V-type proton ATPase subunit H-like [Uloborus diversus]|uniref:V-type proton ATPase subunit H-like n=1 Tax=Uloborus diversus TaxID=327109 RepID=UPI002408F49E|nr:V-type proton ATPase subunit H-like [Uloborus diversus]
MRKHNAMIMQQNKISSILQILSDRRTLFTDPEFRSDFEFVDEIIENFMKEMSTFDSYLLELKGGRLEWSVVHNSHQFWLENAEKFNEKRCELLKILVTILKTSKDSTALCIAAHDLGMYMTNYPNGKRIVEKLGGKEALLELLEHRSAEVKFHALKSLQVLMLNSFDLFLEFLREQNASVGQHFQLEQMAPK